MILKWTETGDLALCVPGTDIWVLTGIIRYGPKEESGFLALLDRQIAQAPAMHELLKKLELSNHAGDGFYCCPVCGGEVEDKNRTRGICVSALGHKDGCDLDAVLKAVEGEESAR